MDGPPISPQQLHARLGTATAPRVVDVGRAAAFGTDDSMIIGTVRRTPEDVATWRASVPKGRVVALNCIHGKEVSRNVWSTPITWIPAPKPQVAPILSWKRFGGRTHTACIPSLRVSRQ